MPSSTKDPPEVCGHKFKVRTFSSHAELHTCRYDETREGKRVNVYARGVYKNGTSRLSWLRRGLWESEEKAGYMEHGFRWSQRMIGVEVQQEVREWAACR